LNILYYISGNNIDYILKEEFEKFGEIRVFTFCEKVSDYHADAGFSLKLIKCIQENNIDAVFSIDYYPVISMVCDIRKIKYLSWIEDCPMLTLMSRTIVNGCNYIFNFDRLYNERIIALGAKNCYHLPLGATTLLIKEACRTDGGVVSSSGEAYVAPCIDEKSPFYNEISFVGSLYSDQKRNRFRQIDFSEKNRGYLEGIISAQELIYGYNLIRDSLTDAVVKEYSDKAMLKLGDMYFQDTAGLVADSIGIEVTARDRFNMLMEASRIGEVSLYSGSELPSPFKDAGIKAKGKVDYAKEMPLVFKNSRINLNISSRTIESGIPRRIFDVLSCGGFCITNYQVEIAEMFEDGKDLVMYTSREDLANKIAYYLEHEDERAMIAENGYNKVVNEYSINESIKRMIEIIS